MFEGTFALLLELEIHSELIDLAYRITEIFPEMKVFPITFLLRQPYLKVFH